jgi:hypothetical protein
LNGAQGSFEKEDRMPETWVHGDMFFPRLYGPDHLLNIDGNSWTDQQGLKDGHIARFNMRDESVNFFHVTIPVMGQQTLQEVRVEYSTLSPRLMEVYVHEGGSRVINTSNPQTSGNLSDFAVFSLVGINQVVDRGICVSLAFTTQGADLGPGEVRFYGAGAVFS